MSIAPTLTRNQARTTASHEPEACRRLRAPEIPGPSEPSGRKGVRFRSHLDPTTGQRVNLEFRLATYRRWKATAGTHGAGWHCVEFRVFGASVLVLAYRVSIDAHEPAILKGVVDILTSSRN